MVLPWVASALEPASNDERIYDSDCEMVGLAQIALTSGMMAMTVLCYPSCRAG